MKLGASMFIRNGIKYDYCFREAIDSVVALCDEVVIMDCQSDDGTAEAIVREYSYNPKIKLIVNQKWDVADDNSRLAILANIAASYLTTQWHLMIQADEVLHEDSYKAIREAIDLNKADKFLMRRYNLFGNHDAYIKFDSPHKPCSDIVCRLAKVGIPAVGDAESIYPVGASREYLDKIKLIHYGFVRRGDVLPNKAIDMQTWFFGKNSQPDKRLYEHKDKGYWDASIYPETKYLKRMEFSHPIFARKWVRDHKIDTTFKGVEVNE